MKSKRVARLIPPFDLAARFRVRVMLGLGLASVLM